MGLSRSLSIGTSSLRAHQQRFDVISNNLANANTLGYKSERANFQEQFNQVYRQGSSPALESGIGGRNPLQFGLGVKLGSIQQDMTQGSIETTNRALDLALQGEGYFVYKDRGQELYSRAGAINHDSEGFLVDSGTGALLQGYNVAVDNRGYIRKDTQGINVLEGGYSDLRISKDIISPPYQTQNVSMKGNLNSAMAVGDSRKMSINIIDSAGGAHTLELTFAKSATANQFDVSATLDGSDLTLSGAAVTFNADGTLNTPLTLSATAADLNSAIGSTNHLFDDVSTPAKDLTIKLGDANNVMGGLTSFAMGNNATIYAQDGSAAGSLVELNVDDEGKIWGSFSNGRDELLGQVALAKFANDDGLIRRGGNMFDKSPNSGEPVVGRVGEALTATRVQGNSLEQSNVDMTIQFTDMISTQRAFEAAARTITVSDQLLAETTQLKR
ncbi:MAG: flagellar hook protein FlgE [Chloroflexota bacterium]